jgi:glucose/arabinose dehydrogenase
MTVWWSRIGCVFFCVFVMLKMGTPLDTYAQAQLKASVFAEGFDQPVAIVQDPILPNIQYVLQLQGLIYRIEDGVLVDIFLDLTGEVDPSQHGGLMSLAFDPNHVVNRRLYVYYTDTEGNSRVSRYLLDTSTPPRVDPLTRKDLRWNGPDGLTYIEQPHYLHNGGTIAFGADGYLYIGLGDGGPTRDPQNRAQTPHTFLGKFLRIDVNVPHDDAQGYRVPPDNPFLDATPIDALPEIWSFGVRNPWKFSFDNPALGGTGALVMGDVGNSRVEEINYEPAGMGGRNYGWRVFEGTLEFLTDPPPAYTPLTAPIYDYGHGDAGGSVSGGYVYRGTKLGCEYWGRYFFGDWLRRSIESLGLEIDPETGEASVTDVIDHTEALGGTDILGAVVSMGENAEGELFILSFDGNRALLIEPENAIWITQITASTGSIVSGTVRDTLCSDEQFLQTVSNSSASAGKLNLTELEIALETDLAALSTLQVELSARINQEVGGHLQVFFQNVSSGQFESVVTFQVTTQTQLFLQADIAASNYVDQNRILHMRLRSAVSAPISDATFLTDIDHIKLIPN